MNIIIVPWWVDMFLLREFVYGQTELLLSPFKFALGRSSLKPWISAEEEANRGACNEDSASNRVCASEIGGESQDVIHSDWVVMIYSFKKIYLFIKSLINNLFIYGIDIGLRLRDLFITACIGSKDWHGSSDKVKVVAHSSSKQANLISRFIRLRPADRS